MDKKDHIFFRAKKKNSGVPLREIARVCDGLVYISETDAPVTPVDLGRSDEIDAETILERAGIRSSSGIGELDARQFFAKLTVVREGSSGSQKARAKKFLVLQQVLEKYLRSLKVYRFGEIRVDILIVGLDHAGRILGVRTNAVET